MPESTIEVRPAHPGDRPEILDLVRVGLGEGGIPRTEAYWQWKHEQNPFGPSPMLVAESGGKLVGLRAFLRWQWRRRDARIEAVRAVDTVTHPDWRGRGIFTKLTRSLLTRVAEEGVSFVFNTPNEKSRPGYLKMGWSDLGRVSLWLRLQRPLRVLKAFARPGEEEPFELPGLRTVEELLRNPRIPSNLSPRSRNDDRLETCLSVDYLRWRYQDIPGFRYTAAWDLDSSGGAAAVFRTRTHRGLRELRLCQLLIEESEGDGRRAAALIREVLQGLKVDYVAAVAPFEGTVARALLRAGFIPAPRIGPILTVRPLNGENPGILQKSSWRLSIGDLELF